MLDPSLDIIDMRILWKKSTIHRLRSTITNFEDGKRDLWKYLVLLSWKMETNFFLKFPIVINRMGNGHRQCKILKSEVLLKLRFQDLSYELLENWDEIVFPFQPKDSHATMLYPFVKWAVSALDPCVVLFCISACFMRFYNAKMKKTHTTSILVIWIFATILYTSNDIGNILSVAVRMAHFHAHKIDFFSKF